MDAFDDDPRTARTALRYLYAAAAASLRDDRDAVDLLTGQALDDAGLGALLDAGTLSIAEQLREVAELRQMPAASLLNVLVSAHLEMVGATDATALVLDGAGAYLRGEDALYPAEALCELAVCPRATVCAVTTTLAAALTWRARDMAVCPTLLTGQTLMALAARDVALSH